jgi:phosphoribosylaminoimidazole-succinocarboxamide synthase
MTSTPLTESTLPLPLLCKGKVREVYAIDDDHVLLVASDRISAFDIVLNQPIPDKGAVLTQLSAFWFERLRDITANHFVTADASEIIERVPALQGRRDDVAGRAMIAQRAETIPFECVVRGYVAGSAWKEYKQHGTLAGEHLTSGLQESDRFDPPIFSPATKAETGHDENVSFETVRGALGGDLARRLRSLSLSLYSTGRDHAATRGIIIADTKFEFGHSKAGDLLLIDEVLTPDSSRFWPADEYAPGRGQRSFDKQPMRDYLDTLRKAGEWNGEAPAPDLSPEIVRETSDRYREAYRRVTGESFPGSL